MATTSISGIGEVERKQLVGSGVRAVLSTGALIAAYCLLPTSLRHVRAHGAVYGFGILVRLGVAFAIFVTVLTLEVRSIARARHPMLRAGVAMAVVIPLFLLFFAWIYLNMSITDAAAFHGPLDRVQALYFTVTIFSTVGFGDITPHTDLARLATTLQMLADLAVIAVVVRLILGVASRSTAERRSAIVDAAAEAPRTPD
jgi:voltage-gated potassium channel